MSTKSKVIGFTLIELLISLAVMSVVSLTIYKAVYPIVQRNILEWQINDYLQDLRDDSQTQVQSLLSQCDGGIKNNNLPIYDGENFSNSIVISDTSNFRDKNLIDGLKKVYVSYKTEDNKRYTSEDYKNNLRVVPTSAMVTLDFAEIENTSLTLNQFVRIGHDLGATKISKNNTDVLVTFTYPILNHKTVGAESPLAFCDQNPYKAVH
ncbi:type II secretion system protein [Photobacterium leiognathi]|uniref:type II secretion system protein n=1 Tax=Photobacterium leiognathi TaxID=553611 RepID=UPI0029812F30|nr:type II secretion system protein [Photobacterium leiognathi]